MTYSSNTQGGYEVLRAPGRNELRCLVRQDMGYYGYLVVAGIYTAPVTKLPFPLSADYFFPALKHCLDKHPILSAAVKDADTESPRFVRPKQLDMKYHVQILNGPDDGRTTDKTAFIRDSIVQCHDRLFQHRGLVPPWFVTAIPLADEPQADGMTRQLLISFSFAHSHGDGTSGRAFHTTFLEGLQQHTDLRADHEPLYDTPDHSLLPALEQVSDLTISWKYLLGALLADHLPAFLRNRLGLAPISPVTPSTWLARAVSWNPADHRTGLEILVVKRKGLKDLLAACRAHNARLTGFLHQLIVQALRQTLPKYDTSRDFTLPMDLVAVTPLNLRPLVSGWASAADMALGVSAAHQLFPGRIKTDSLMDPEQIWEDARQTSTEIASAAGTLTDQPIGLLRFVSAFRPWLANLLGKDRDASYELSNIMAFDPDALPRRPENDSAGEEPEAKWEIGSMYFSQPANATGAALNFNVVSRKDGDLIICLSWQRGALGLADEDAFAKDTLQLIQSQIEALS